MSTSTRFKVRPTTWLVRIKECRNIQKHQFAEVDDPENGMVLGNDDDLEQEDDESLEFNVNSVASKAPRMMSLTLQCPQRQIIVETNAFVWPYPVWITVRIEIHTKVIYPPNHVVADCLQRGWFTPLEYFISDWLAPSNARSQEDRRDLSGGIGCVSGVSLVSQFLSSLRPEVKGNSDEAAEQFSDVQAYDRYKLVFCEYLNSRSSDEINLTDISTLLSEYEEESNLDSTQSVSRQQVSMTLRQRIICTAEGNVLQMASEAPDFFRLGPVLFPRKICSLMIHPSEDTPATAEAKAELFKAFDSLIVSEPWKLGFSNLVYGEVMRKCKRKKWSGIEANLNQMKKATFYHDLTKQQKDALHIYDTIKVITNA